MKLTNWVENELEEKNGVHYLKDHRAFRYNDGDAVENYIFDVISNATDISSDSRELESKIKDWPSLYHLSRERAIAYNSLTFPSHASVLEVGCGCGAITRFVGENVAHVLALEGSPRRADIARARTRDLESVAVLCASFEDVVFNGVFDVIICNGVLEYAPLFVKHANPAREFIRLLTSLLKPTGNLIVAIENKLGLRYFSSGKEEHTNIMFDGLEGYARFPNGPRTFGFAELHEMISEHCSIVETFLPLPDYKLPKALIRAELLDEVNCAELFATLSKHDFGTYVEPRMHERLVWQELQNNHLLKAFANSYFIIAGNNETFLIGQEWMGDIYAIKRNADLMVRTRVSKNEDGEIRTKKGYFRCEGLGKKLAFEHVLDEAAWVDGVSIHTMVVRAMLQNDAALSPEGRFRSALLGWWEEIKTFGLVDGHLRGEAYDCIWQNAITRDGKVYFIDKEWKSNRPIDPIWLIYRSVSNFVVHERHYLHRWSRSCQQFSELAILRAVSRALGLDLTFRSIISAIHFDLDLLESVNGTRSARFKRLSNVCVVLVKGVVPLNVLQLRRDITSKANALAYRLLRLLRRMIPGR